MPELPEVEATRVLLTKHTPGRRVVAVSGDPMPAGLEALIGATIGPWRRRGKRLAAPTEGAGQLSLHLGMTGKIVVNPEADRRHVRVGLTLDDGTALAFIDTRRLGAMTLLPADLNPFEGLGPDALELLQGANAGEALAGRLAPVGRTTASATLKDRALDQARIAGLGNIAIIEGAHRASLHPHAPVASLSPSDWKTLADGLLAHLTATLVDCLATDEVQYVSQGGPNPFGVYGREGEGCPRCPEATIARLVRAGRPTFVCPCCQGGSIHASA